MSDQSIDATNPADMQFERAKETYVANTMRVLPLIGGMVQIIFGEAMQDEAGNRAVLNTVRLITTYEGAVAFGGSLLSLNKPDEG